MKDFYKYNEMKVECKYLYNIVMGRIEWQKSSKNSHKTEGISVTEL